MRRISLSYLLMAISVMVATHYLTLSIDNMYVLLIARIIIAALLYMAAAWTVRSKELYEITNFLFRRKADQ